MATAQFESSAFNMTSFNQCVDPDVDSFVDYGAMPSPSASSSRLPVSTSTSTTTSPATTMLGVDQTDDHQTPAKPSHEYERWKQQTGLPSGSVPGLQPPSSSGSFSGQFSNSGLAFDDMGYLGEAPTLDAGWNSGLGMGADVNMELDLTSPGSALPAFFFAPGSSSQPENFVNPSAISPEETKPNVRFWPGMHQQQAALAKAQQQAQQQRQQQMLQQQQQQKQRGIDQQSRASHGRRTGSNQITDARTEETITRVVNQIRQNSTLSSNSATPPANVLPHIVKMKKDEEDMDEDERLLASEEGKKLSSKERRQLRNKVSARAFRSRRKEYIGQLEGEVAIKTNEANELRTQNHALMEENARYRAFTEKLLRHPAFQPFLEDLSRDPALSESLVGPSMQTSVPSVPSQNVAPAPARKEVNFSMPQQTENPQIGMALIPETHVDLGMNNWAMPNMGFNFQQPQVYSVLELPEGPASPINTDVLSGKGCESILEEPEPVEEVKPDYPVIERPSVEVTSTEEPSEVDEDDGNPDFALFYNSSATTSSAQSDDFEPIFGNIAPEKAFAHFELFVTGESDKAESQRLLEQFERRIARIEPVFQRLEALTSCLDL